MSTDRFTKGQFESYKSKNTFEIAGRGKVLIIDLEANSLPTMRKDFSKLIGQNMIIDNKEYKIRGIEAFAKGMELPHKEVGFLVTEIK